jgi:hypothetical protein
VLVLLVVFLRPTFRHEWRVGMGPDVAVYLWWARLGAARGISLVGDRPGIVALIPTVAGTLHLPLVAAVAGLQYVMAVLVGVGATAVVRGRARGGRWAWALAGLLAGLFAVHLAGGYVANLAFTVPFLAAGCALASRSRRGTEVAALLLGGAGLMHPQFFLVGAAILAVVAAWSWLRESDQGWSSDGGRVTVALAGGGALVGLGVLAMQVGPAKLDADTSKDAFLRRTGLADQLRGVYLKRFQANVGRYLPWLTLPLAAIGVSRTRRGFTRRFLTAWAVITMVGVPLGILTRLFPPDRIMTFAFALPILAALGVTWVWDTIARRASPWLAWPVSLVLIAFMVGAAITAWGGQQTFLSPDNIGDATAAGRIAATVPEGTPLVFIVNGEEEKAAFVATLAANLLRAALPPERADDVYVYVGDAAHYFAGEPTPGDSEEFDMLSRRSLEALPERRRAVFVVRELDRDPDDRADPHLVVWSDAVAADVANPRPLVEAPGELRASSPHGIAVATVLAGLLLWAVGFGWARWALGERVAAVATAPGFGVAVLGIAGLTLERLGLPLTGSWGPTLVSVVGGGLGYLLLIFQGQAQAETTTQIDEGPDQQDAHGGHDDPVPEP